MDYPDETALRFVIRDRQPMALTGIDLVEAIRRLTLAARTDPDITNATIMSLVKVGSERTLNRIRDAHGIPPMRRPPDPWARPNPGRTRRRPARTTT